MLPLWLGSSFEGEPYPEAKRRRFSRLEIEDQAGDDLKMPLSR
jgi:hypothetical protein